MVGTHGKKGFLNNRYWRCSYEAACGLSRSRRLPSHVGEHARPVDAEAPTQRH